MFTPGDPTGSSIERGDGQFYRMVKAQNLFQFGDLVASGQREK